MLLVIPAIEILGGRCVQMIQGVEGYTYSDDPVSIARLWRTENAKSLHVTDVDGIEQGRLVNTGVIRQMMAAVDIPVELGRGFRSCAAVAEAFALGAYRVVVGSRLIDDAAEAERVIREFGASKVVLGIDAVDGIVAPSGISSVAGVRAVDLALAAKALGFRRVVYSDLRFDGTLRGVDVEALRAIAATGMRVTCSGGVSGLRDLLAIQELESLGVDSAIIGRALCENRFACQDLWRRCEAGNYPYTAKV
jgi:phosphoribosylformimino-5-aminoimidazole carboxamide ribotide isomerase